MKNMYNLNVPTDAVALYKTTTGSCECNGSYNYINKLTRVKDIVDEIYSNQVWFYLNSDNDIIEFKPTIVETSNIKIDISHLDMNIFLSLLVYKYYYTKKGKKLLINYSNDRNRKTLDRMYDIVNKLDITDYSLKYLSNLNKLLDRNSININDISVMTDMTAIYAWYKKNNDNIFIDSIEIIEIYKALIKLYDTYTDMDINEFLDKGIDILNMSREDRNNKW